MVLNSHAVNGTNNMSYTVCGNQVCAIRWSEICHLEISALFNRKKEELYV